MRFQFLKIGIHDNIPPLKFVVCYLGLLKIATVINVKNDAAITKDKAALSPQQITFITVILDSECMFRLYKPLILQKSKIHNGLFGIFCPSSIVRKS